MDDPVTEEKVVRIDKFDGVGVGRFTLRRNVWHRANVAHEFEWMKQEV